MIGLELSILVENWVLVEDQYLMMKSHYLAMIENYRNVEVASLS